MFNPDQASYVQIDFPALWKQMIDRFALGDWSLHGPNHWRNVERNALLLSRLNGADESVVRLFALFHDVERHNEGYDPEHGQRAADFVETIHGSVFTLPQPKLILLLEACRYHNDGGTSPDVTIGTCWDADRLDLPRVGITPTPSRMSTTHGQEYARLGPVKFRELYGLPPTV